uniref:SAM domain-containing protein n=2 Tax=Parascaris univalens TaxID=6257 RepID=A0A915AJF2_PARUN
MENKHKTAERIWPIHSNRFVLHFGSISFMRWTWRASVVITQLSILLLMCITLCRTQKATKSVVITADDEKLRDPEGYAAIVQLHRQMDDDHSGSIDRFESNDFLREDMKFGGSDREKREKAFHHNNDEQITVDDLWEAWFSSEERAWTTAEVVAWLENSVRLPQYSNNLIVKNVDGRTLPRMAVANSTYLATELGIKNAVHKHKIHLKALDVVLFGFSGDGSSRMKDIALSILLCVLIAVLVLYKRQRSRSRNEMEQLTSKLRQLKSMESDFEDVQQKFEEERKKRQSVSEAIVAENAQMETLRSQLMEAERLLESSSSAPLALQPLLRRTCELEMSYVGQQRLECIAEMREAIELIDKLRKKQSSLMSSIKLATGGSTGTDQVDSRIFSLKARMEKISLAMEECQQRWIEIESLCGFPLMVQPNGAELTFMGHTIPTSGSSHLPRTPSMCSSFYRSSGASSSTSGASTQSGSTTVIGSTRSQAAPLTAVLPPTAMTTHQVVAASHKTSLPTSHVPHVIPPGAYHQFQSSPQLSSTVDDLTRHSMKQHEHHNPLSHTNTSISQPALLPFKREVKNQLSKASPGSTDSNEEEEDAVLRRTSGAAHSVDGVKKLKIPLPFRKTKHS